MKKVIFPGSFDPITLGHLDIIRRGSALFDNVTVLVQNSLDKKTLFTAEERIALIESEVNKLSNVQVILGGHSLTILEVRRLGGDAILRGLRSTADYEREKNLDGLNHDLAGVETLLLLTREKFAYVSSSLVKEITKYGEGEEKRYLPTSSFEALQKKKQKNLL